MTATLKQPESLVIDLGFVDKAVERFGGEPDALIPILQAIQEHYQYVPESALRHLCQISRISPATAVGVASFYAQFRREPSGKHLLRVCHGTACHVNGSQLIQNAVSRHLQLDDGQDTDEEGLFTVERVGCLGCCTLAPVVQIGQTTYGHVAPDNAGALIDDFLSQGNASSGRSLAVAADASAGLAEIRIGVGSCCISGGSMNVRQALERAVRRCGASAVVKLVGCVGMCHQTPLVEVVLPGRPAALYAKVAAEDAEQIVARHFGAVSIFHRTRSGIVRAIDRLITGAARPSIARHALDVRDAPVCGFLDGQLRIATEHCGRLNPLDLAEYEVHGGFAALRKVIGEHIRPQAIIDAIEQSGLRGRGGAGFHTGRKWASVRQAAGEVKYLICNGDEGDPGAFMDRMILESYPFRVLEGMMIAAIAVGASRGILYIRHEYPLAVQRIRDAIEICLKHNLLGQRILGSDISLELDVHEGAGAFVCGEETALIASVEGRRGMPRLRPPFPAETGLWGKPTCINNVETFAQVPWIIRRGPDAFAAVGTDRSKGTKVFALTGKIARGGLIEVPLGTTIRQIVEQIGGGIANGRTFKAVQIGGPSGGCIPASLADTPVDYESLAGIGAIMGSGGLVVLDESDCMVDMARYFLHFAQIESCGKCTFCRIGTRAMLDIFDRLCEGRGQPTDLGTLEQLAHEVKRASLCGLGQTAPNPVLTTLRHFRDEYEAHLHGRCPAGRCKALIRYVIDDRCIGCTKCAQVCADGAIAPLPYALHMVDDAKCTRCDMCRLVCPVDCIKVM